MWCVPAAQSSKRTDSRRTAQDSIIEAYAFCQGSNTQTPVHISLTFAHAVRAGADLGGLMDLDSLYQGVEQSINHTRAGRMRRQSLERSYNIEVLLGVDDSVVQFHGKEHVQKYLLTLMNIVSVAGLYISRGSHIVAHFIEILQEN